MSRSRHWLVGIVGTLLAGCTTFRTPIPLTDAAPGHTTFHAIPVGDKSRTFLLHLPPAAATRRVPLVLVFHGHTANADVAMRTSEMNRMADSLGIAVLYPDGSGRVRGIGLSWNVGSCCGYAQAHQVNDIAFVDSLHAAMIRTRRIDMNAVFAAGFSAGGMMALKVACERATIVRAVADVAGAMPDAVCTPAAPVAVLLIHGDDDDELRYDHSRGATTGAPAYARSYDSAAVFWERINRCAGTGSANTTQMPGSGVRSRVASACGSGRPVQVVSIPAHPHAWPGGRSSWWFAPKPSKVLDGSAFVLTFFAEQLRRDSASTSRR